MGGTTGVTVLRVAVDGRHHRQALKRLKLAVIPRKLQIPQRHQLVTPSHKLIWSYFFELEFVVKSIGVLLIKR